MPACAEVNRAMQELSGAKYSTNEQNKETGKSRQRRDMKDTHTLLLTMSERNPFAESTSLRNIMTGVNATGDVDVCRAKEIGQKIMDSVTGIPVAQYTVKRSDQVTTLQSKSSVHVDGQPIHVNPELLFQRLIVASNAIDDRRAIFRFELCSYPSALVDDTLMPRAPQKAVLANAIWTRFPPDIAGPTEDVEGCLPFERRQQTELHRHVESLPAACLAGCLTEHAEEDAELLIAQTAMQSAAKKNTVLVADDTDLVILLCYYADPDGFDLFMQCSIRGETKKNRIWDIKVTQSELGADICNNILFMYAILGCDTTSRLYGLGKGLSLKRFTSSALLRDKAEQFYKKDATVDAVIDAGEVSLVCLYSGKEGDNVNGLRYAKFCDKVATNKVHIRPQTLPPVSAAVRYHSMRVYMQVQQWLGVCNMKETDWGWMRKDENLVAVMTDLPPAPDELLRVIRCNCTTDRSTARCSCRKHSLECSTACGQCRGIGCSNTDISDEDDDDDDR